MYLPSLFCSLLFQNVVNYSLLFVTWHVNTSWGYFWGWKIGMYLLLNGNSGCAGEYKKMADTGKINYQESKWGMHWHYCHLKNEFETYNRTLHFKSLLYLFYYFMICGCTHGINLCQLSSVSLSTYARFVHLTVCKGVLV